MRRVFCFGVVLLLSLLRALSARAAYSNYNSILIGEQAAGLGGAYVAMSGDASGAPFYNPAGLAWMKGNSFSSAVSIYKKFDTLMGKEEDIIQAPLRVNQGFFQSIPSSSGSVMRWRDYNVGLTIVVPEYETFKGDLSTTATNTSTLSYLDESLWVGGTMAKTISKNESAGLTIYYTARNYNRTVQDRTVDLNAQTALLFTEEKNITGNAIIAVLGYQYQYNERLHFGLSLRAPSLEISGSGSYFKTEVTADGTNLTIATQSKPSLSSHTRIPGKATLGFAYRFNKWLISADGSVYGAERYFDFEEAAIRSRVQHRAMYNGALGIEYRYSPWLILRSGGFTNLTSHEELEVADKYGDRVDQLGWAANFTLISKEKIRFTFGGYYTGGRGKAVQRINQSYTLIPKTQQVFTMLISTAYYF